MVRLYQIAESLDLVLTVKGVTLVGELWPVSISNQGSQPTSEDRVGDSLELSL